MIAPLEIMLFETSQDWERWLEDNHAQSPGVRLKIAKKASAQPSLTYAEALEVALCFGWIDSLKEKFDDDFWLQRFTPRKGKSPWSAINRGKADGAPQTGQNPPGGAARN